MQNMYLLSIFKFMSVSFEDVTGIDFVGDVVKTFIIAIGYDCLGIVFEFIQVIDYK